jgi:hypothetical protein
MNQVVVTVDLIRNPGFGDVSDFGQQLSRGWCLALSGLSIHQYILAQDPTDAVPLLFSGRRQDRVRTREPLQTQF